MGERLLRRIPEPTAERLPLYHRVLADLARRGARTVSSAELAEAVGVNAAKVRKDLSYLGSYGTRGTGYEVPYLLAAVERGLGLDRGWPIVIVGVGNLGHALARSEGFNTGGFEVVGLFDADPAKHGERVGALEIRPVEELPALVAEAQPEIGVIATPAGAAQDACDRLVGAGVPAVLNFAPVLLSVPPGALVRQVDLRLELQVLAFYRSQAATADLAPAP
jgi:redox-sensing transcriptional repressor